MGDLLGKADSSDVCFVPSPDAGFPGDNLLAKIKTYNPDFDEQYVRKAVVFAVKYHGSQMRKSGDPYYYHPIAVAEIVADLKLDVGSVVTALLHDTVEDTEATLELIEKEFGREIAYIVDGVTKLDKIQFKTESEKQAENFRKFLMAISDDIRVLLVKLADRLHNMRTLHFIDKPEKRKRIANETMEIYAPLAERIGLHTIKAELQDIAFKEIHPDFYESAVKRLDYLRSTDDKIVPSTIKSIQHVLDITGVKAEVSGREKMPFSIWLKMDKKKIGIENVTDIIAFRIITESIDDCYRALGAIHRHFRVVPGYFDDYVSNPKANNYQSIHTIVMSEDKNRVEVQIRTREMHEIAEYGIAAHWSYKQDVSYSIEGTQYRWVRQLLEILANAQDPDEVLENAKLEMYHDQVFTFTPGGDLIVLPRGATPVDFAFAVHTRLGSNCAGAKVNGRVIPLRTKLKNGDQVEIIKAKTTNIQPVWETFVKTGTARSEIRRYIRMKKQGDYTEFGKSIIQQLFMKNKTDFDEIKLIPVLQEYKKASVEDLYSALGQGGVTRIDIAKILFPESISKLKKINKIKEGKVYKSAINISSSELSSSAGIIKFASCCNPIPGEKITGIQSLGDGVIIHNVDCEELENYVSTPERWVEVKWDSTTIEGKVFLARLEVVVKNQKGVLASVARIIAKHDASISNIRIGQKAEDFAKLILDVEVQNIRHLAKISRALKARDYTHSVNRYKESTFKMGRDSKNQMKLL
jgi:GTP pyrophosphokinase